jgi:uncharacterized membrane protein
MIYRYNINLLGLIAISFIISLKIEKIAFKDTEYDTLVSAIYFYMTEVILIAIVSFIVLMNSIISLCCKSKENQSIHNISEIRLKERNSFYLIKVSCI